MFTFDDKVYSLDRQCLPGFFSVDCSVDVYSSSDFNDDDDDEDEDDDETVAVIRLLSEVK